MVSKNIDNNFEIVVVDYIRSIVAMRADVTMVAFDDSEIVPCRTDRDSLDRRLSEESERVFPVLVRSMIRCCADRF